MDQQDKKTDNQGMGNKGVEHGQQNIPNKGTSSVPRPNQSGSTGGQSPDVKRDVGTSGSHKEGGLSEPNKTDINKSSDLENDESDDQM